MRSKYCFIRTVGKTTPETFIYVVWVGSSLRELAILSLVEEYAKDQGLYFKRWSRQVDSVLDEMRKPFRANGNALGFQFRTISVSIRQLSALIRDDAFSALEKSYVASRSELWCRFHNSLDYVGAKNHLSVILHANPSGRKNLSPEKKAERSRFVAGIAGIILLILADAVVSNSILSSIF